MPAAKKVAWAQLRVGVMAVGAMIILGVLIFLLTGSKNPFAKESVLYTFMDDSAALTEGSPVRLNGILVGEVQRVALSGSNQPQRIIRIDMEIREDMLSQIPIDSRASIAAENVLGTKYINIKKGVDAVTVKPGAEIPSLDTREFDEVVQSGYSLLTSLQGILKRIDAIVGVVEVGKGSIGKLIVDEEFYNRLLTISRDFERVTAAMAAGKGTLGRFLYDETLYEELRGPVARFDVLLRDLQEGRGTAGRFLKDEALYNDMRQTIGEVRSLLAELNAGKGTAGKLLKTEELHNQISGVIAKLDNTIDRVNAGQGTVGQLLTNPQLYDSLNGATRELNALMKDFRADPRKFLRIKLSLF
jgi:phospholipid/cholesterol/gamma-HCH transport system substrate-binding protein